MERAKNLIKLASLAGADFVKFQKRCPEESTPRELWDKPHPNQYFAHGTNYLEHRKALELTIEQHAELQQYCSQNNIKYAASVWDMTSAKQMVDISPEYIKVPSSCNLNFKLLSFLLDNFNNGIHISTGMTTKSEIHQIKDFITQCKNRHNVVIYHCTSEYPCSFDHIFLNELKELQKIFSGIIPDENFGFSDHGLGYAIDLIAYLMGGKWIERHFVDDRTVKHTDAAASLEPDGLRRLCRDLKIPNKVLQYKESLTDEELRQRQKLRINND